MLKRRPFGFLCIVDNLDICGLGNKNETGSRLMGSLESSQDGFVCELVGCNSEAKLSTSGLANEGKQCLL